MRSRREDGPQLQIVPPAHRVVAPRHRDPRVDPWTDFPLLRLNSRLKCPRCGSRYIVVMFHPSATTASFRARASLMLLRATHGVFGKSSPAGRVAQNHRIGGEQLFLARRTGRPLHQEGAGHHLRAVDGRLPRWDEAQNSPSWRPTSRNPLELARALQV